MKSSEEKTVGAIGGTPFNKKTKIQIDGIFMIGCILTGVLLLPYLLLGDAALITVWEQLDGGALGFILQARHMFQSNIPELLSGVSSGSLISASPLTVLIFWLLPPYAAYLTHFCLIGLIAFLGMYLCLKELTGNRIVAVTVGLVYILLPFLSVYGLSAMGQPLLFYAMMCLSKGKRIGSSLGIIVLFAGFSSLVLSGYADLIILTVYCIVRLLFRRKCKENKWIYIGTGVLAAAYILFNINLIMETLFSSHAALSHRTVWKLTSNGFIYSMKTMWNIGQDHAVSLHGRIKSLCIVFAAVMTLYYPRLKDMGKKLYYCFLTLFFSAAVIAVFYGLWHSAHGVSIRTRLGGLFVSFQADRFYWLYPSIWFLLLGLMLYFVFLVSGDIAPFMRWKNPLSKVLPFVISAGIVFSVGIDVYKQSDFKPNLELAVNGESAPVQDSRMSWNRFFAEDVFTDIKEFIGKEQSTYRVASIALYPSIALYNGFYCIDGYSSNYPLAYKNEFRKIIAMELEKDETIKRYFDDWGNRAYLFTAQIGLNFSFSKSSSQKLENLSLNTEQLRKMNCQYIFSGLEIKSPEKTGLSFLKSFETDKSVWRVYVYRVD